MGIDRLDAVLVWRQLGSARRFNPQPGPSGCDYRQALEDGRLRAQLAEGLSHARQAVGVFSAVAGIEPNQAAVLDDLEAEAIPLGSCSQSSPLGGRTASLGARGRTNARRDTAHDLGENAAKINVGCRVPFAGYFFIAGVMLMLVCGLRINVRVLRTLGAWHRKRKPDPFNDFITGELERIRLRDTVGLEIAGLAVGTLMTMSAISFLHPDWPPKP